MDFFLQDQNEIRLPPEEIRLVGMEAVPLPDGRRVKISLELTPFQIKPNLEVTIHAASGKEAAHASILETMLRKLEFTLHLRQVDPGGDYSLECVVYYQKLPEPGDEPVEVALPEPMVVDRRKMALVLPAKNAQV